MRKELISLATILLIVAGLPATAAHSDGNTDGPLGTGGEDDTYPSLPVGDTPSVGSPTQSPEGPLVTDDRPVTDGVSGDFVGPGGIFVDGPNPVGFVAGAVNLCDAEALGGSATPLATETWIDGTQTPGFVADGTWDDGGVGGACHTAANTYPTPDFNSPGCGGPVRGDTVTNIGPPTPLHLLVYAACDDSATSATGLATCLANVALQNAPGRVLPGGSCWAIAINPFPPAGSIIACGPDGRGDAQTSGDVTDATGFAAPSTGSGLCPEADESLSLFAFIGVDAGDPSDPRVSVPIVGWLTAESGGSSGGFSSGSSGGNMEPFVEAQPLEGMG